MVEEGKNFIEFIYCACNCGFTRPKYDIRGRERRYINRHERRGKPRPEETRRKISKSSKGRYVGEKGNNWKGDKVGYVGLHLRVRKYLPKPEFCQICKKNPSQELSNISRKYIFDLNDWQWLCKKCHRTIDKTYERNLKPYHVFMRQKANSLRL